MAMTVVKKAQSMLGGPGQSYMDQGNDYLSKASNLLSGNAQYNPDTDPVYASAKLSADRNAQSASNQSMADMNRRGILNSTITTDRDAQIKQDAANKVTDLIPQLANNFQNQQQNQFSNYQNLANSYLTEGQNTQNYGLNLAAQNANETGFYVDPSLPSADQIQQQMDANSEAWKTATPEEQQKLHQQNIDLSAKLGKSYDPKTGTYSEGNGKVQGTPTLDLQKMLYGSILDNQSQYGALPQGSGKAVSKLPAFSDLSSLIGGVEQQPTLDYQKYGLDVNKNEFDQNQAGISNDLKQKQYDLSVTKNNQDADYQGWLKSSGISKQNGEKATNGYTSKILGFGSRDEAINYLNKFGDDITNDGANISNILNAIDEKWPKPSNASSGSTPNGTVPDVDGQLNP